MKVNVKYVSNLTQYNTILKKKFCVRVLNFGMSIRMKDIHFTGDIL